MNPQNIILILSILLAIYSIYILTIDRAVEQSNHNALNIHSATLAHAKKLYSTVEKEMSKKLINSEIIIKNELIIKLNSQLKELENRKKSLLDDISRMEQGDLVKLLNEIELIRDAIGNTYNNLERELSPVLKLIDADKLQKADHVFKSVKHKHSGTVKNTDEVIDKLKAKTKRLDV